jgi:Clp amino terminal domain, pathogenicity island component
VSMWEPFSHPARRAVVRAQEVAQMFGANFIGTEHLMFALAEGDDPVGAALASAVDPDEVRKQLGDVSRAPSTEMAFTSGAKRSIELAFENARRLNHSYIGTAHLALGILGTEPPALLPGHDAVSLRAALEDAATHDAIGTGPQVWWTRFDSQDPHVVADAVNNALSFWVDAKPGTRVKVTVTGPGEAKRTWSWLNVPKT